MMKNKKIVIRRNYLEKIPQRIEKLSWSVDEEGKVTLEVENKGWANRLAQIFFKRPRVSYVHMDELGSFLWPLLDGEKNIIELGVLVKEKFGKDAEPLYERLARFFQILDSYHFITFK